MTVSIPLIALSWGLCFLGISACINLCEQLRMRTFDLNKYHQLPYLPQFWQKSYVMLITLGAGGIAIWSVQIVGILAIRSNGEQSKHLRFNVGLLFASLLSILSTSYVGLLVASSDQVFCKSKGDIAHYLSSHVRKLPVPVSRGSVVNGRFLYQLAFSKMRTICFGGILTGAGICAMEYLGMYAMLIDGVIEWNVGLVALSCIMAIGLCVAMFWLLFRLLSAFPESDNLRLLATVITASCLCAMHYIAASAATFRAHSSARQSRHLKGSSISAEDLLYGVVVSASLVIWWLSHLTNTYNRVALRKKTDKLYEAERILFQFSDRSAAKSSDLLRGTPSLNCVQLADAFLRKENKDRESILQYANNSRSILLYPVLSSSCFGGNTSASDVQRIPNVAVFSGTPSSSALSEATTTDPCESQLPPCTHSATSSINNTAGLSLPVTKWNRVTPFVQTDTMDLETADSSMQSVAATVSASTTIRTVQRQSLPSSRSSSFVANTTAAAPAPSVHTKLVQPPAETAAGDSASTKDASLDALYASIVSIDEEEDVETGRRSPEMLIRQASLAAIMFLEDSVPYNESNIALKSEDSFHLHTVRKNGNARSSGVNGQNEMMSVSAKNSLANSAKIASGPSKSLHRSKSAKEHSSIHAALRTFSSVFSSSGNTADYV